MSLTTNKAVAATAIGVVLRRLGRKAPDPDFWEAEHLVRALACLACGQYRRVFHYVAVASVPTREREPAAVEHIAKIAAQHVRPSLATLQMVLEEIAGPDGQRGVARHDIFGPIAATALRH